MSTSTLFLSFTTTILLLASLFPNILALLYPTNPVASTIFQSGRIERVDWVDDNQPPSLAQMGRFNIGLYTASDVHLSTIAKNVDPQAKSISLLIPMGIPGNSTMDEYQLHFYCPTYKKTVWSAPFIISNLYPVSPFAIGGGGSDSGSSSPSSGAAGSSGVSQLGGLTIVLPSTTITTFPSTVSSGSSSDPSSSASSSSTSTSPSLNTNNANASNGGNKGSTSSASVQRSDASSLRIGGVPGVLFSHHREDSNPKINNSTDQPTSTTATLENGRILNYIFNKAKKLMRNVRDRCLDVERLKFRLIFIVWPALVGISLAI